VAQPSTASPGSRSQAFDSGSRKFDDRVAEEPGVAQDLKAIQHPYGQR
jgi:hypothetical protein